MALPPRLVPPRSGVDPARTEELRHEVRQFLAEQLAAGSFTPPSVDAWLCGGTKISPPRSLPAAGWA